MTRSSHQNSLIEETQQAVAVVAKTTGEQLGAIQSKTKERIADSQESRWETPSPDSADTEDATNLATTLPHHIVKDSQLNARSEDSDRQASEVDYEEDDPLAEFLGDEEDDLLEKNATAAVMELLSAHAQEEKRKVFSSWIRNKKPDTESETGIAQQNDNDCPPETPVLSKKAAELLGNISSKMNEPTKNLVNLIAAISPPVRGEFTRAYIVRRKNACGAIHVLTSKKGIQRVQICWTKGVLGALLSVLQDGLGQDLDKKFPNPKTRKEYKEARKRVVATLMNLSIPQENRVIVFHSPRLVPALIQTILSDEGCRKSGAAALAHLAKTKENRLFLGRAPSLIDAVVAVIEPKPLQTDEKDQQDVTDFHITQSYMSASSAHSEFNSEAHGHSFNGNPDEDVDLSEESRRYDEDGGDNRQGARQNTFALLLHLVKEKDNAYILARHAPLVKSLAQISRLLESDFHEYACKVLAHLTRHRSNTRYLLVEHPSVIQALATASYSQNDESRKHSCFALQNFSEDKSCRHDLAGTKNVLPALCVRIRQAFDHEERLAAVHAMKNLSEEPSNLIVMTNTAECFPTLMQIADASDDNVSEMMQFVGCDAFANLSEYFRLLATSGKSLDSEKRGEAASGNDLFVPSLNVVTWEQWE